MPSYRLNDLARMRIEELSFFLVVLLVCGLGVKWLWNLVAKDFQKLPRLGYGRALALTTLLGLFTLLVLSMISGARELLTPKAWRRQGSTYQITDPANESVRKKGLEMLRVALWAYAKEHEGKFPKQDFVPEMPDSMWLAPDANQSRYVYFPGEGKDGQARLLALEPYVFEEPRFGLLSNGEIRKMSTEDFAKYLVKPSTK